MMTFDDKNEQMILGLHPVVQKKARQLLVLLSSIREDILITSGSRTAAEQTALFMKGRDPPNPLEIVTYAKAGESMHNWGLAFDFVPVGLNGRLEWKAYARFENVAQVAKTLGFMWGGLWDKINDQPHLEYTQGLTLKQLRQGMRPQIEITTQDLQDKLKVAEAALNKPWITLPRKFSLKKMIERIKKILNVS